MKFLIALFFSQFSLDFPPFWFERSLLPSEPSVNVTRWNIRISNYVTAIAVHRCVTNSFLKRDTNINPLVTVSHGGAKCLTRRRHHQGDTCPRQVFVQTLAIYCDKYHQHIHNSVTVAQGNGMSCSRGSECTNCGLVLCQAQSVLRSR
jgi:hypothetical protein